MSPRLLLASGALMLSCAFGCSDTNVDPGAPPAKRTLPVVGGEPAEEGDYPSTVALISQNYGAWEVSCTGTLVAPTVVLTAAHCVQDWWGQPISANQVRVVYGYTNPANAPVSDQNTVSIVAPHPGYNWNAPQDSDGLGKVNDIGVLVLNEPIDGVVTPILPPSQIDSVLVSGTEVHVAGYGVTDLNNPYNSMGILYKALTPYVRHIQWEMLAGSPGNPDSCNGDSGGPAYVDVAGTLYLAGVTSRAWKKSQKLCGDGGIYTLASAYVDWIEGIGGELDGGVIGDAGMDATLLDADPVCFPLTKTCNPMTNEGCDTEQGEVCQVSGQTFSCHPGPASVLPGGLCDQTDRFCVQGFLCGASLRCERYCCSDTDCPQGGPCTPLSSAGTLGTCGVETVDAGQDASDDGSAGAAGSGGEGGSSGEAGSGGLGGLGGSGGGTTPDAGREPIQPDADSADDGGCGCRTAGNPSKGAWLLPLALGWFFARRRFTS